MLYMVTFTINIPQMLAYIPYMEPMGYSQIESESPSNPQRIPSDHIFFHIFPMKLTIFPLQISPFWFAPAPA